MKAWILALAAVVPALGVQQFDVVVYGGTPGGVATAISAARLGRSVALIEYHKHLGGMTTSGLGKSDIETREAVGGLFVEFTRDVHAYYVEKYGPGSADVKLSRDGYYYEPSVALRVMNAMVAKESRVRVFLNHRLEEAIRSGNRLRAIRVKDRATGAMEEFRGGVFVDGTYEGDLAAFAGARYRLGRESRAEFNELHAGVVYQNYETRTFLAGTTGEGDHRIPAYTYRLCLTSDPANARKLTAPPPDYDRNHYLGYLDDWRSGRFAPPKVMVDGVGYFAPTFNTVVRALSIAEIPNKKTDVNMNPRPLGFPFPEMNYDYPEAGWDEREKISERIRNLTLGLLYFLQNDAEIPAEHRKLANQYNLAKDEFTDNDNFPFQLYVREARRIVGEYTLTENDTIVGPELGRTKIHADSIAAGEFPVDSFPVRRREKGHDVALEGYIFMLYEMTRPYQIPYRVMVPETVDGLLVPVAASTTHVAFSTVRLEPTWMALGQAAGAAAHLALSGKVEPRAVDGGQLQRLLLERDQVITYFKDIDRKHPAYAALQYFGARGFFLDYEARADEAADRETARRWWKLATKQDAPPGSGVLTKDEVRRWLRDLSSSVADNAWTASAGGPVTRGELCRALYAATAKGGRQ
ncbi:MAG: FAD-dependent oxidoreductase [Bryobacterales bacterium]|nr:FAD-dependent oxidoreductase [Bryobacterales bacterium]